MKFNRLSLFTKTIKRILYVLTKILNLLIPKRLIIIINPAGFFSNFNKVINHLVHSLNHNGIRAIEVNWSLEKNKQCSPNFEGIKEQFNYGRPEDGNIWEHFFEQLPFKNYWFYKRIITPGYNDYSMTGTTAYKLYKSDQKWRRKYNRAFQKYIRIKPYIKQKVETFYSEYMAGRYCIGVHIRNLAHGCEQQQKKMPTLSDYIDKIKNVLKHKQNNKIVIFLATEVEEVVERFKNIFGDIVIVQPRVIRSPRLSKEWNDIIHIRYPKPNLKLGEDVLIDCLLLAKCDLLIHITSNIATAVGYINPSIDMIYCE